MPLRQLAWQAVEKVWGRRDLPALYRDGSESGEPIGEIWFEDSQASELLVKSLFTSEKLSIQVHPSDEQARASGHVCGKDEAWFVLSADPGATIGAGFEKAMSSAELREASLDGSVEDLLVWHTVQPGDFFYVPAGTVHAIGAGLSLLEIQQNVDLTYRLYDYGRPRDLQIEEGVAASKPGPYIGRAVQTAGENRDVLAEGPKFVVECLRGASAHRIAAGASNPVWLMPVTGKSTANGSEMQQGTVWLADSTEEVRLDPEGCLLIAYPGTKANEQG